LVLRPGVLMAVVFGFSILLTGPIVSGAGVSPDFVPLAVFVTAAPVATVIAALTISNVYFVVGVRRRTLYAVTDQRLMLLQFGNLQYVVLRPGIAVQVRRHHPGRGRLEVGSRPGYVGRWEMVLRAFSRHAEQPCLWMVDCPDADEVAAIVNTAAASRAWVSPR
jgi:hypothetical protein